MNWAMTEDWPRLMPDTVAQAKVAADREGMSLGAWIEGVVLRALDERDVRLDFVHRFTVEQYLQICDLLDLDDPELIDGVIYDAVKY